MRRAFTLVELLVVMGIMALAAVTLAPSFARFHRATLLRHAAYRTLALAGEARTLAMARDTEAVLRYDRDAQVLRLEVEPVEPDVDPESAGGRGAGAAPAGAAPLTERLLPDARSVEYPLDMEVELDTAQEGPPAIRFDGDGRADEATLRLRLDELEPVVLVVNPRTGRMAAERSR